VSLLALGIEGEASLHQLLASLSSLCRLHGPVRESSIIAAISHDAGTSQNLRRSRLSFEPAFRPSFPIIVVGLGRIIGGIVRSLPRLVVASIETRADSYPRSDRENEIVFDSCRLAIVNVLA